MIPVCRDETSTRPSGKNFTLQLHLEIKFRPDKAGQFSTSRNSHPQMFFKIGVLKNLGNFIEKHLCWSLFLVKLQA